MHAHGRAAPTGTSGGTRSTELEPALTTRRAQASRSGTTKSLASSKRIRAWMLTLPVDAMMLSLPALWAPQHWRAFLVTAAITLLLVCGGRTYRARLHVSVLDELPGLAARVLVAVAVVATVTALRHEQDTVESFLTQALPALGLLVAGRVITSQIILWARRRRIIAHRTLVVGGGAVAEELTAILARYPRYGLQVVGYVGNPASAAAMGAPWLGPLAALEMVVADLDPGVIVVVDGAVEEAVLELVRRPETRVRDLLVVPRLHRLQTQVGLPDHIGSMPIMRISTPRLSGPASVLKRGVDIAGAAISLLVLSPVLAACALAIWFESGSPVLFRQDRVGRNGQIFCCLKFRSMTHTNPEDAGTCWSVCSDERVGTVGRLLRRTSLDEMPQLWNILRGDMTFVGPRPERPHFVDKFSAEIPSYRDRHRVRAGLTGLAQVNGLRGDTSIVDRARFDNYYIEYWSLWLDVKILLRTFAEVLFARGR
jgi:exopolysaccharide biosynthesis polyprenyl glycosylphosphotransferase